MQVFHRDQINAALIERASSDPDFRALLMSNPGEAVSELTGIPVPPGVTINVHVESPANAHFVLPPASDLSDADLELVAGGLNGDTSWDWWLCG